MVFGESLMRIVVKVRDAVGLARRFEASPGTALREVVEHVRVEVGRALEEVMDAEIGLGSGSMATHEFSRKPGECGVHRGGSRVAAGYERS
jgi:hypothetical protein